MAANGDDNDWIDKLYKPKFSLDAFLKKALDSDDDKRFVEEEVQVDLPRSVDHLVNRAAQTDSQLWSAQDVAILRRAYASQVADVKEKYSAAGSPYDMAVQEMRAEIEELRENWRSTQQELDNCRIELGKEKCESTRLRIAVEGLKQFSAAQLAEADDARWVAQFERASANRGFKQRLEQLQEQQAQFAADRKRQVEQIQREQKLLPSLIDLRTVYRISEETKAENRRLQSELVDAVAALAEYERAYKMLLKHVDSRRDSSPKRH